MKNLERFPEIFLESEIKKKDIKRVRYGTFDTFFNALSYSMINMPLPSVRFLAIVSLIAVTLAAILPL